MVRGGRLLAGLLLVAACGGEPDDGQRLVATGTLLAEDGTPLSGRSIDEYELTFSVLAENDSVVDISRTFSDDGAGEPLVADVDGRFQVSTLDLALTYDWVQDEYVCDEVCVAWDTFCYEVTEEVCLDTCSEEQCWEDCWDDCVVDCYDEVVCDDYDCWTETYCDETCTPVCENVCDVVSYPCNCYLDSYDVCEDQCVDTVQECGWIEVTYTSLAELEQILNTHARIRVDGETLDGDTVEAFQHAMCDETCQTVNLWIQNDRFFMPTP